MRRNLPLQELGDLLDQPIVSTLATYRRDGTVLLSPVWHEWHDGGFNICAGTDDVKVRHLRRDPRASLVLYDQRPPYRGVEMRGVTRLVDAGAYAEALRRIAVRYLGQAAGTAYAGASSGEGVVIRLEAGDGALRTWDFADDNLAGDTIP